MILPLRVLGSLSTNSISCGMASGDSLFRMKFMISSSRSSPGSNPGLSATKAATLLAVSVGALLGIAWLAVWAVVAGMGTRHEVPAEPATAYASLSTPLPGAATDGRVTERVVGGKVDGTDMFIDLDTGELHSMPAGVVELPDVLAWMRRTGADALYGKMMSARSLIGADLAAVRVSNRVWDEVEGGRGVAAPSPAGPAFPVYLEGGRDEVVTYCVRTREGGTVLVQIVQIERGAEGGMRIRSVGLPAVAEPSGAP